jgi:uncharacterized protein YkwD
VSAVLLLVLAVHGPAAPSAAEVELRAVQRLRQAFEQIGRVAPQVDSALTEAARALAVDALASSGPAVAAAAPSRVAEAISRAGAWDPAPRAFIFRATPLEDGLLAFQRRADLAVEPATHAGVAVVAEGERGVIAIMLSDRKAELHPFPRRMRVPADEQLCGELRAPLAHPEVFVTQPKGSVEKVTRVRASTAGFCAWVGFPTLGRYAIEVLGTGPGGPEVAALFSVEVGEHSVATGAAEARGTVQSEPATATAARVEILARINALRAANGVAPMAADARLDTVAQAYAERMAEEHFFAHVSPNGDALGQRLRAAGYPNRANGENLGLSGSGPLGAHLAVEESPGHRSNLLNPAFTHLGLGIAREALGGQTQTLLVEILAAPDTHSGDPIGDAYHRIAEQRAALGLPQLVRSPQLEAVAAEQARIALEAEDPHTEKLLAPDQLHARVTQRLAGVESTSADLFVAEDLTQLPRTRCVADVRKNLVGVGAVRADAPPGARETYWVVVIYADRR